MSDPKHKLYKTREGLIIDRDDMPEGWNPAITDTPVVIRNVKVWFEGMPGDMGPIHPASYGDE